MIEVRKETVQQLHEGLYKHITLEMKILKRTTWLYVSTCLIIVMLIGIVIWIITRPLPANEVSLRYVEARERGLELEKKMIITDREALQKQAEALQRDREDITRSRDQVLQIQNNVAKSRQEMIDILNKIKKKK